MGNINLSLDHPITNNDDLINNNTSNIRKNPDFPGCYQTLIDGKWVDLNITESMYKELFKDFANIDSNSYKNQSTDAKADTGKLQISLVPMEIVRAIARIRMYGNEKYHSPSNWTKVEKRRYIDAMMRHLLEYLDNEDAVDSESGLPALWHAACNMAFICEMQRKDWDERKEEIVKGFADIEGK